MLYLDVLFEGRRQARRELEPGARVVVGRDEAADLSIPDPYLSRRHFEVSVVDSGRIAVHVYGGKNALRLDGRTIDDAVVEVGAQLEIGRTRLIVRETRAANVSRLTTVHVVDDAPPQARRLEIDTSRDVFPSAIIARDDGRDAAGSVEKSRYYDGLYELTTRIGAVREPQALFDWVMKIVFEVVPADRGFVALGDPHGERFDVVKVQSRQLTAGSIEMSRTILDEVRAEARALLVHGVGESLGQGHESVAILGIESFLCCPILLEGQFFGMLYLDQLRGGQARVRGGDPRRPLAEGDLGFLLGVSHLTALAIDRICSLERLERVGTASDFATEDPAVFVAESEVMIDLVSRVPRVAASQRPLLIRGETGVGKELIARRVHDESSRRDEPFIAFNCALSSPQLIESELFGHVKGAFTDAASSHKGRFELASGGTLFLDEIGDMPLETQAKLLRVLQDQEIWPVGGEAPMHVDVRLIAATHRDLEEMRRDGRFRDDLYFRLAVLELDLPPLRERADDTVAIAKAKLPKGYRIEPAAIKALEAYAWPGNVRELENSIEQAIFHCAGKRIRVCDLPKRVTEGKDALLDFRLGSIKSVEARHIRRVLRATQNNKTRAAEILGIARETLYQKLKQLP